VRHFTKNSLAFLVLFITMLLLNGCDDETESISGDYYPLNDRTERYQEYISFFDGVGLAFGDEPSDTTTVEITSSVKVDGRDYKVVSHSRAFQRLIRREGCRYFARDEAFTGGPYGDEYLFLDASLPVGSTWTIDQPTIGRNVEFTIKEKNTSIEVFDRSFNDVIIVQEDTYRGFEDVPLTIYRYYQKDVGEVYNYLPYPLSLIYADAQSVLMK
jgi:hypothetical protein